MAVLAQRIAASVEYSLAIEVSVVLGRPASLRNPARHTSIREASASTTMSAIIACTSWKEAIGRPNCSRSLEYETDSFTQPWQIPTQPAATEWRPESSADMAVLKPS